MLISLESTTNRMNRLSTGFLYNVEPKLPEVTLQPYLEVTGEDVRKVAGEILDSGKMAVTMIAPSPEAAEILDQSPFSGRNVANYYLGRTQQAEC